MEKQKVWVLECLSSDPDTRLRGTSFHRTKEGATKDGARYVLNELLAFIGDEETNVPEGDECFFPERQERLKHYRTFVEMYQREEYDGMLTAYTTFCKERPEHYWYCSVQSYQAEIED